jgi:hypothetical protein
VLKQEIEKEFSNILKKRDVAVRRGALRLYDRLVFASPVDTGELKQSWQAPIQIVGGWQVYNIAPHAIIIDGGRRNLNGEVVGSEQLPLGFTPIVDEVGKELQEELNAI